MHELSIAQNIIEMIQDQVPARDLGNVTTVRLKVGAFAGVVPDSLEFSFEAITSGSPLSNARLEIETVPFRLLCNNCGTTGENDGGFSICETCGSTDTKILTGSELNLMEIEIIEPEGG
jgi:hydrogenase nickel incorporation protein HypA/HybF